MPNVTKYSLENMKGKKYGKLTVVGPEESERKESTGKLIRYVWCKCDCGNMYRAIISALPTGRYNSCGCELEKAKHSIGQRRQRGEFTSSGHTTHGLSHTRLHSIWCNIKTRCYNPNADNYHWYGGRGIKICDEWRNSFEAFADWAYANGYNDHLEIDRIDSNGDYEPKNCRWKNRIEQTNNLRSNYRIYSNIGTYNCAEWARMLNVNSSSLNSYIHKNNISRIEDAIKAPFIGYHKEDHTTDALIFVDKSKVDYSNYTIDYNRKDSTNKQLFTSIPNNTRPKNFFTK